MVKDVLIEKIILIKDNFTFTKCLYVRILFIIGKFGKHVDFQKKIH